ncbi:MAG: hypothetical protein ACRD2Z_14925 [Thermoanaerobaculia bacterium]
MAAAVEDLTPLVGTRPACRALGVAPATIYRRRQPPAPRSAKPRRPPARKLAPAEREAVLAELHSQRFVDASPAQVWATLLDEGRYLASERTLYRLLAKQDEVRERRDQLVHPPYAKPELLAEWPNELWSWDITKLLGPVKWTYYSPIRHLDRGRTSESLAGLRVSIRLRASIRRAARWSRGSRPSAAGCWTT